MTSAPDTANPVPLPIHPIPELPDAAGWRLELHDGERSISLDPEAIARLPHTELVDTFTCLAGWSTEPLHWRGVRLSTVLGALATEKRRWLAVSAPDFRSVLALDELPEEALLADALDGQPLTAEHGGPLRLVVPGGVCYQSVKWVRRIEVQDSAEGDTARRIALGRLPKSNS